jgi:hypothetical protein
VKPKFFAADLKDNKVLTFNGDSAKFVCSAKGNPLKTEWKKQTKNDEKVDLFSGKYVDTFLIMKLTNQCLYLMQIGLTL